MNGSNGTVDIGVCGGDIQWTAGVCVATDTGRQLMWRQNSVVCSVGVCVKIDTGLFVCLVADC